MFDLDRIYDVLEIFLTYPLCVLCQLISQKVLDLLYPSSNRTPHQSDQAHCYQVLYDFKKLLHYARPNGIQFFLLKYKGMRNISHVMKEDDVTLYNVTPQQFQFVRVVAGVDLRDIIRHPFTCMTSHRHAVEVLIMSHEQGYKYLGGRGDENASGHNIVLLHNTGRCGSTLLANMVHRTEEFHVISEPYSLTALSVRISKQTDKTPLDCEENHELLRATLLFLCKDPDKKYLIKVTGIFTGSLLHLTNKALPGIRDIFLHRSLLATVSSWHKILGPLRFTGIAEYGKTFLPLKYRRIWQKVKPSRSYQEFMFIILCQMHPYFIECENGRNLRAFSYEYLRTNQEDFCVNLLSELGLEKKYVSLALSALDVDSQENSPLKKFNVDKNRTINVPGEALDWIVRIGQEEFGMEIGRKDGFVKNMPNS
ncbi:hypothetical protein ACHWQZ_G006299 [Mnemiopsis leidyi]